MKADPRWRDLAMYTLCTGMVILALFVLLGFFAIDDGAPLHPWAGLLQRILCAVWFTCTIVLAVRLRRLA
jgi:ABC-type transport system involved in cytochrome c biogenesis permease subunit